MAIRRAKLAKEEARASEFSARSSAATNFSNSTERVRQSWHIPTHGREAATRPQPMQSSATIFSALVMKLGER